LGKRKDRLEKESSFRDCPDFCISNNGTVPFAASCATFIMADTKALTAPYLTVKKPDCDKEVGFFAFLRIAV
jgi:hypothetical protein